MSARPGFLPTTALTTVAPGTRLLNATAQAWRNMRTIGLMRGVHITPVDSYGSGYRDWDTAMTYYRAGQGDRAAAEKCNIDPNLHVNIAYPPGSHGGGTRIDMLFDHHSPDDGDLTLAMRYGFTREFGTNDPNHFMHDGRSAVSRFRDYDRIALVAKWLNNRHMETRSGPAAHTRAEQTGQRDPEFVWMVQHAGHLDHHYPAECREDGIAGPHTEATLHRMWVDLYTPFL